MNNDNIFELFQSNIGLFKQLILTTSLYHVVCSNKSNDDLVVKEKRYVKELSEKLRKQSNNGFPPFGKHCLEWADVTLLPDLTIELVLGVNYEHIFISVQMSSNKIDNIIKQILIDVTARLEQSREINRRVLIGQRMLNELCEQYNVNEVFFQPENLREVL